MILLHLLHLWHQRLWLQLYQLHHVGLWLLLNLVHLLGLWLQLLRLGYLGLLVSLLDRLHPLLLLDRPLGPVDLLVRYYHVGLWHQLHPNHRVLLQDR